MEYVRTQFDDIKTPSKRSLTSKTTYSRYLTEITGPVPIKGRAPILDYGAWLKSHDNAEFNRGYKEWLNNILTREGVL